MQLTEAQRVALAERIADEFNEFVRGEYEYQVEDMKDNDELSWDYLTSAQDAEDIKKLVIDIIAVPVP